MTIWFKFCIVVLLYRCGCLIRTKDLQAQEFFPSYFEALNPQTKRKIAREELRYRQKYSVRKLSDWQLLKLQEQTHSHKKMSGVVSYDILENNGYKQ